MNEIRNHNFDSMKILKLWVVTSCTVEDRNMWPLSSGQKIEMESYIKIFIPTYQIMWCHIVNSYETVIQRVLPSPKVALDTNPTPPPQKGRGGGERSPNFVQKEAGIIDSA